jgi:hypothetical protein
VKRLAAACTLMAGTWLAYAGAADITERQAPTRGGAPEKVARVLVAGSGGERVKAAVYDPAGKQAGMADNICLAHRFFVHRDDTSRGEVWALQTMRSSNYYLEDYSVDLVGIPPILSTTVEGLLTP